MPAPVTDYVQQIVPPAESARRRRAAILAWGVALAVAALGTAAIAAAPVARSRGAEALAAALYGGFSVVCHQMPERSFWLAGFPLAVCARCAGMYAGMLAGVALYPLLRPLAPAAAPARVWLLLAVLPTSLDWALGVAGLWENTHLSRSLTASLLGVASAFYVVPGLVELAVRRRELLRRAPAGHPGRGSSTNALRTTQEKV